MARGLLQDLNKIDTGSQRLSVALLVVHLFLNWQWLVKVAASKHVWRLAAGLLTGLLVVGAFLLLPVEKSAQNGQGTAEHLQNDRSSGSRSGKNPLP